MNDTLVFLIVAATFFASLVMVIWTGAEAWRDE